MTLPVFSPHSVHGKNDVGAARSPGEERVDRDHRASTADPRRSRDRVGEVGDRVGTDDHEHVDLASAAASRMPCVSRPPASRHPRPTASSNHSRPASSDTRPGRKPGTRPASIRAVHVAAPQRREEPHVGTSRARGRAPRHAADVASERDRAPRRPGRGGRLARWAISVEGVGAERLAGHRASDDRDACRTARARTGEIDQRHAELDRGAADAAGAAPATRLRGRGRAPRSPPHDRSRRSRRAAGRARPRRAGRRRSARRRCRCRSRPS